MAHDPKLEVFKIILAKKEGKKAISFREFFRRKSGFYKDKEKHPSTNNEIFKIYYENFVQEIDKKGYKTHKTKKKAFTIAVDNVEGNRKSHITFHPDQTTITGVLDGGKHGIKRSLGDIHDTSNKTPIDTRHIVNDRFFFLIYTPIDHNEGIVMIQGYTEAKISDVFKDHLVDFFSYMKEIESKIEIFTPKKYKEKYLKGAVFKKVSFSSGWSISPEFDEAVKKEYDLEVKIEIIDRSRKKTHIGNIKDLLKFVGKSIFNISGNQGKKLDEFEKMDAKMESSGRSLSIDLDDQDNISPVILLKDLGIEIREGNVPDFLQIERYCRNLLEEIKQELLPTNAVKEL